MPDQGHRSDRPPPPTSAPPESAVIDANWDDDIAVAKLDDPDHMFDRITAVPLMPPEIYVPRMMAQADRSDKTPRSKPNPSERPNVPDSLSLPAIDSLNPPACLRKGRRAASAPEIELASAARSSRLRGNEGSLCDGDFTERS